MDDIREILNWFVLIAGVALVVGINTEILVVWLKRRADRKKHWRAFLINQMEVVGPEILTPNQTDDE